MRRSPSPENYAQNTVIDELSAFSQYRKEKHSSPDDLSQCTTQKNS